LIEADERVNCYVIYSSAGLLTSDAAAAAKVA